MTYKQLLGCLAELTSEQLDCNVTVELGLSDECLVGEFRIADCEHDILDEWHPIIYVPDA
jgi:hypothetical protein